MPYDIYLNESLIALVAGGHDENPTNNGAVLMVENARGRCDANAIGETNNEREEKAENSIDGKVVGTFFQTMPISIIRFHTVIVHISLTNDYQINSNRFSCWRTR